MGFVTHLSAGNHFKRHGLDIIMELERRERQQLLPWHWGGTVTGRWSSAWPLRSNLPKSDWLFRWQPPSRIMVERPKPQMRILTGFSEGIHPDVSRDYYRKIFKSGGIGISIPNVPMMLDLDFTDMERRLMTPRRHSEDMFVAGRRFGQSLLKMSAAAALATYAFKDWGNTWDQVSLPDYLKPTLTQGPGKEVEQARHRGVDPKRVAKDRLKKKLAKKARRK